MSVNKVNKDTGELVTLASGQRMWVGTNAAHTAAIAAGTMPNNCMVCITDDGAGDEQYSTEETYTGKKWIDGKKIYRKCYVVTSNFTDAFNMPSNIDFITDIRLMTQDTTGNMVGLYYSPNSTDAYNGFLTSGFYDAANNQWHPQIGANRAASASKWVYIFEYTKTTD